MKKASGTKRMATFHDKLDEDFVEEEKANLFAIIQQYRKNNVSISLGPGLKSGFGH